MTLVRPSQADEPLEQFIEGLKERGYYDVAFDYLERSETSGAITPALKARLDYERAQVLLDGVSEIRDREIQKENLDRSQELLLKFIKEKEFHPYASIAKKTLGDLLIRRAQIAIIVSELDKTDQEEAKALVLQARDYYTQADEILKKTRESLKEMLKRLDPNAKDSERRNLRKKYEEDYLRARLLIGLIPEELANTYEPGSEEAKKYLESAIAEYVDYANDYSSRLIGLRAKFNAARCMQKLDKNVEATTYIREILDQDDNPVFRDMKRDACLLGSQIWFNEDPPEYLVAINSMQPLLDSLSPNLEREEKWLELKLAAAKAYRGYQMQMKAKTEGKTADDRKFETMAKKLSAEYIREVARMPSVFKEEAQQLLLEWDIRGKVDTDDQDKAPESFVEARDRVNVILGDYENDKLTVAALQQQLQSAPEAEKAELTEQLKEAQAAVDVAPRKAIDLMRLGLRLAGADTPRDEFEPLFYRMAYCHYALEEYHESLVVAEHLMLFSPNSVFAKGSAQIGVKSLLQLSAASDSSSQFEVEQLRGLCDRILKMWPSDPVAVEAAAAMIQLALKARDVEAAEAYLQRLPDGTTGKDTLQLNVGLSLWASLRQGEYNLSKEVLAGKVQPAEAEAQTKRYQDLRVRAQSYFAAGAKTLEADGVNTNTARSMLALAQIYTDFDKMDEAVAILENPVYGPLALVGQNHPATTSSASFKTEAYQTALRAYVGSLGSAADPAAMTDKARDMMQKLKESLPADAAGKQRLIGIYLRMARDVKTAMASLESDEERAAYQAGLVAFLDAVQREAEDVSVLVWVSGTLTSFAEAAEEKNDDAKAAEFYQKAAGVYRKLIEVDDANPDALSDVERREMTRRLARAMSQSGKFQEAIELYVKILTEKSAIIDVQVEAAEALQAWGKASGDPNAYARAMAGTGDYVDPKTERKNKAIWGWGKLASTVIRYDAYRKQFIPARYNLAVSRFEYAKLRDEPKKYLEMAEKDVSMTLRSDPTLGGPEWRAKFDALLKQIQKELGKPAKGLPPPKKAE